MPVLGRPRAFDRDAALQAAVEVFWRQGFLATSMNDLCAAMGIRSPSLYAAFGSKEALYLEAVEHYARTIGPSVWDRLMAGPTARAGVESLHVPVPARAVPVDGARHVCLRPLGTVAAAAPSVAPLRRQLPRAHRAARRLAAADDARASRTGL